MNEKISLTIKSGNPSNRAALEADEKVFRIRYPFREYSIDRSSITDIRCTPYKVQRGRWEYCMIELYIEANSEKYIFSDRLDDAAAVNIINGKEPSVPLINMYEFLIGKKLILPKFARPERLDYISIKINNINHLLILFLFIASAVLIVLSNIAAYIAVICIFLFIFYLCRHSTDVYADSSQLLFREIFRENKVMINDIENISAETGSDKMHLFPTDTIRLIITMKDGRKYQLNDKLDTVSIVSDYINGKSLNVPLIRLYDFLNSQL